MERTKNCPRSGPQYRNTHIVCCDYEATHDTPIVLAVHLDNMFQNCNRYLPSPSLPSDSPELLESMQIGCTCLAERE